MVYPKPYSIYLMGTMAEHAHSDATAAGKTFSLAAWRDPHYMSAMLCLAVGRFCRVSY